MAGNPPRIVLEKPVELKLIVTAGPHTGKEFAFDGHDTFLVGRIGDAHLQLSYDDPYFSRRHFVVEINPPRCRVLDLGSRNGTFVNGARVATAELAHGDEIGAGHTRFKVAVFRQSPENQQTLDLPSPPANSDSTAAYLPGDQAIENSPDGRAGFSLDGYDVHELLGRGGMGEVYRATRRLDGADVAIKTITPAAGTTKRQVDRFLRECHILAQLSHPNVVGYFDARGEGGRVFLVTELVAGPDLGTIARQKSLAAKTAVRLICQMLGGLAHAHEKGFVHRDIKPANILLGGKSGGVRSAKLADFGLARAYQASKLSGLTMQGEIGGTPAFMAPEQVTHYRDVKPAADQYSAAASLYTLLTGYYPHDMDGNAAGQLVRISTQPSVPIADRGVRLPQGLSDVIHRALSQEPRCRFPDVLAFRKALIKFA